jgi:hypothetical protein
MRTVWKPNINVDARLLPTMPQGTKEGRMMNLLSKALIWLGKKLAIEHDSYEDYDKREGLTYLTYEEIDPRCFQKEKMYLSDEEWLRTLKQGGH